MLVSHFLGRANNLNVNKVVRIFGERGGSNRRTPKLHAEAFHSLYPLPNIIRKTDELCEHGNEFLGPYKQEFLAPLHNH